MKVPMLVVVDNVSSHNKDDLQAVGKSKYLFWDAKHDMYLYFGIAGLLPSLLRTFPPTPTLIFFRVEPLV